MFLVHIIPKQKNISLFIMHRGARDPTVQAWTQIGIVKALGCEAEVYPGFRGVSTISLRFRYFAQIQIWTLAIDKLPVSTEKDQDDNNNKLSGNILGYQGGHQ